MKLMERLKMKNKLEQKPYFKNVEEGDKVFGLVFGPGVVDSVWGDGFYKFEVRYTNGHTVPYTMEGIPGWSGKLDFQTIFYADDVDLSDFDHEINLDVLTVKQIIKLRIKGKLEIQCPSLIWQSIDKCPSYVMEDYLEQNELNRFRKA